MILLKFFSFLEVTSLQKKAKIMSNTNNLNGHHGDGVNDESSSSDDNDDMDINGDRRSTTINITSFEIIDDVPNDMAINEISYHQPKASTHGEPRRLIHIWLRVLIITLYLVVSAGCIYVMIDGTWTNITINTILITTILIPTILFFVIFIKPSFMPRFSCLLLIIIILLRLIQWIFTLTFEIKDNDNFILYFFAILGAMINENGFLCFVLIDFYEFYCLHRYDLAIFSVHYNSQKAIRFLSILLFLSSILWSIYCYGALGNETQWIDTWFYLILAIISLSFIAFEYLIKPIFGRRLGFPFCCVIMLYILFLWGDNELLSFTDIATAAILPQLMCLTFAWFTKFREECM